MSASLHDALLSSSSSHDQCPVSRHRSHPRFAPFVGHLVRALVVATVLPRVLVFPLTESQPWSHHLLCRRTMYALLLPLERVDSVCWPPRNWGWQRQRKRWRRVLTTTTATTTTTMATTTAATHLGHSFVCRHLLPRTWVIVSSADHFGS